MYRLPVLAVAMLSAAAAFAQSYPAPNRISAAQLRTMTPSSPNPYLAFLPEGVEPDYAYWNAWLREEGQRRARSARSPLTARATEFPESEPNNTQATGDFVSMLGFGSGKTTEVDVTGSITNLSPTPAAFTTDAEDNGSIPLASAIPTLGSGAAVITTSFLGDGLHGSGGSGSGDYDFFALPGLVAGDTITLDITTADNGFTFDSALVIWDSAGNLLAFDTEESFDNLDALLNFVVPEDGTYYAMVGDYYSGPPADPFDSGSGTLGAGTEGHYDLTISRNVADLDIFTFDLTAGDVLHVNFLASDGLIALLDPAGSVLIASSQDLSGIYPPSSPLIGGGLATAPLVAPSTGRFALAILAPHGETYTGELRLFRPALDSGGPGTEQTIFVDFNGATFDNSIFGASGMVTLSPLSAFLANWGLNPGDESAVIDAILASIEESLRTDLLGTPNPFFDVTILNSRDHADPFGNPNVSRLIVGGTISEFGISTIGLAQSIDPGNFETEETGVILLDLLSASSNNANSLNQFGLAGGATKIELVAVGVGNISVHEAGHYVGNFHTEQFVTPPNIMDQGGNLPNTVGVGDDGDLGSGDDIDVDFGPDLFVPSEGLLGTEDTLSIAAFGLTTPPASLDDVYVQFGIAPGGNGTIASPTNTVATGLSLLNPGGTLHIYSGSTGETVAGGTAIDAEMTILNQSPGSGVVRIGSP